MTPAVAVKAPCFHTALPLRVTTGLLAPYVGTAIVPLVPLGAVTVMLKRAALLFESQRTPIAPCGVGTRPWDQLRSPGLGCTVQVAYPAVAGRTPRTYPDSAEVGAVDQPWDRLAPDPRPGVPSVLEMFSHSVPVWSGPGAIMWPHSVCSRAT